MLTQRQVYTRLYLAAFNEYRNDGWNDDKSSRKANLFAVKNTWDQFNKIKDLDESWIKAMAKIKEKIC